MTAARARLDQRLSAAVAALASLASALGLLVAGVWRSSRSRRAHSSWIWRRRPWGYVLAVVTSVKGVVYMTALTAATFAARRVGALPDISQAFLWTTLGVASAVAIFVLLGHMTTGPTTP